ncbi:MAG: gfo/Idh/MocA family oxidoreductase, partial [Cyclobacteriaceae bacterium]
LPKAPGYGGWDTYETFTEETKKEFEKRYKQNYGDQKAEIIPPAEMRYEAPRGYDMRADHFADWVGVIRNGGETVQGAEFGMRAAGPALASNLSHYENKIVFWDPIKMKLVSAKS